MTTKITHARKPPEKLTYSIQPGKTTGIDLSHVPHVARFEVLVGDCGVGGIDVFTSKEPEPIPMSEMQPGDIGQVVTSDNASEVDKWAVCERVQGGECVLIIGSSNNASGTATGTTVRLLQPGESLTITVEDDAIDASLEVIPDDQFERLADGKVVGCKTWQGQKCDDCSEDKTDSAESPCFECATDWKARDGHAGSKRRSEDTATQAPTLDDALRTGTAEEALATFGDDPDWEDVWPELRDSITRLFGDMFDVARGRLHCRSTLVQADCIDLAREVVSIRDRLGLFGEVKNATD